MFKINSTDPKIWSKKIAPLLVVAMVSAIGAYLLIVGHATSVAPAYKLGRPYSSLTNSTIAANFDGSLATTSSVKQIAFLSNGVQGVAPNNQYIQDCLTSRLSATCYQDFLNAINSARTILDPGLGPMNINVSTLMTMSPQQQLFTLANAERVQRGLRPFDALTNQLNNLALTGALNSTDPHTKVGTVMPGGATIYSVGSNWAGGNFFNALIADYYWMYDDNHGSVSLCTPTSTTPHPEDTYGCWGHRNNILGNYSSSCTTSYYMGSAYAPVATTLQYSFTQTMVGACGPSPTDITYTWQQALNTGVYPPPASSCLGSTLYAGQKLLQGKCLLSPGGQYKLTITPYSDIGSYLEIINTANNQVTYNSHCGPGYLIMQTDGNLVQYLPNNNNTSYSACWTSGTGGLGGYKVIIQNDGNLVMETITGATVWSIRTGVVIDPPSTLDANHKLYPGQQLFSTTDKYRLILQTDGNLVIYNQQNQATWATGTNGKKTADLAMQNDGNLVLYDDYGTPLWKTSTQGQGGTSLTIQDDGNLVMHNASNVAVWSLYTGVIFHASSTMNLGSSIHVNEYLLSPSGTFQLILQPDGNLVEYNSARQVVWTSSTYGQPSSYLTLSSNGDIRQIGTSGQILWHAGTFSLCASQLVLQDDGNLVLKNGSTPVWSTYGGFIGSSTLGQNQTLSACQYLMSSPRGEYRLVMQPDGNLVDYNGSGQPVWYTNTVGTGANHLIMQPDGNLVLYTAAGQIAWYTNTEGMGGTYINMQNNGNVVMFQPGGWAVWSWQTGRTPPPPPSTLYVNQSLSSNQSIVSSGGVFQLILQPDGNLVIYNNSNGGHIPIWQLPGAYDTAPGRLIVQPDGNLVLYNAYGTPIWYVGYGSGSNNYLIMQPDGNLVYYNSAHVAIWWSGT